MILPPLYAIVDQDTLDRCGVPLQTFAEQLREAGVRLLQYRHKSGTPRQILAGAAVLRERFNGSGCTLILNDRADLAVLAGFDGVHVGQNDLSPGDARAVIGPAAIVGVSTHTEAEMRAAAASCADYVAVGPVFATSSKPDAAPVVGLEGVRLARTLTTKPLVAIGGITPENRASVHNAGADSVAMISGLFSLRS